MRFLSYIIISITFFSATSSAQPYVDETMSHHTFEYSLRKINATDNADFKNIQEEFAESLSSDTELRVYPTVFDLNSSLLLHIKKPAQIVELSIIDVFGNTLHMPLDGKLDKGFYEISVLSNTKTTGIFIARLVIDGKVYTKHIIR